MKRDARALAAAALACVLGACASSPGQNATACRFTPPEPRSTEALRHLASDRGLGGSGINTDDRGLGGSGLRSGIIGIVTGFGSICVNGYEIDVDAASRVTVEGRPATPADIHLGQLVVVEAESRDAVLRAASIDVRLAAVGPVSEVSGDGRTLTVLGQTVRLAALPGATPQAVTAGDWVAVSGLRGADASIEGTSVVRLPEAGTRAMVAGVLEGDRPETLGIGELRVSASAFKPGDAVIVEGVPAENRMSVVAVRPQLDPRFTAAVRQLSLQTFLASDRVMGLRIAPSELRPVIAGAMPVQIEGRFDRGNTLVPERVVVPMVPRDGQRPDPGILFDRGVIVAPVVPGALRPIDGGRPIITLTPPTRPEKAAPPTP